VSPGMPGTHPLQCFGWGTSMEISPFPGEIDASDFDDTDVLPKLAAYLRQLSVLRQRRLFTPVQKYQPDDSAAGAGACSKYVANWPRGSASL